MTTEIKRVPNGTHCHLGPGFCRNHREEFPRISKMGPGIREPIDSTGDMRDVVLIISEDIKASTCNDYIINIDGHSIRPSSLLLITVVEKMCTHVTRKL
jgi:hypothetical protein